MEKRQIQEIFDDLKKDIINCSLKISHIQKKCGFSSSIEKHFTIASEWTKEGWITRFTIETTKASLDRSFSPKGEVLVNTEKQLGPQKEVLWNKTNTERTQTQEEVPYTVKSFLTRCGLLQERYDFSSYLEAVYKACRNNYLIGLLDEKEEIKDLTNTYRRTFQKAEHKEEINKQESSILLQIDDIFNPYIAYSLGLKHDPSVEQSLFNYSSDPVDYDLVCAAKKREENFIALFTEASLLKSEKDLFEFQLKIKSIHKQDESIASQWTSISANSVFFKDRQRYIDNWKTNSYGEKELLNKYLWILFDRKQNNPKDHECSIWFQQKNKAFEKLNLTQQQWSSVYSVLKNIKRRIDCDLAPDQRREESIISLRKDFKTIVTLEDLNNYIKKAKDRSLNKNGAFSFSSIDLISIEDERKWQQTCFNKRNKLVEQFIPTIL